MNGLAKVKVYVPWHTSIRSLDDGLELGDSPHCDGNESQNDRMLSFNILELLQHPGFIAVPNST